MKLSNQLGATRGAAYSMLMHALNLAQCHCCNAGVVSLVTMLFVKRPYFSAESKRLTHARQAFQAQYRLQDK